MSADDRRAHYFAKHATPGFIGRYMELARSGQSSRIPSAIRASFEAYAKGTGGIGGDVEHYVYQMIYDYRVRTGGDHPFP